MTQRFPRDDDSEWRGRSRHYYVPLVLQNRPRPPAPRPPPPAFAGYAIRAGGDGSDRAVGVSAVAADGSVFVVGGVAAPALIGSVSVVGQEGKNADVGFVARVSRSGQWLWATQAVSTSFVAINSVVSLADGSAMVCGRFDGELTLGATTLTAPSFAEAGFVARISGAGAWLWGVTMAGVNFDATLTALARAGSSHVVVAGTFSGGGTSLNNLSGGSIDLTNASGENSTLVVAKLSIAGAWAWAAQSSNLSGSIDALGLTTFADGSAAVCGDFRGSHTIGATLLEDVGDDYDNAYVAKVDASGAWQWAVTAGSDSDLTSAGSVGALPDGSMLVGGTARGGPPTFGEITFPSPTDARSVFVARLTSAGAWVWVSRATGPDGDQYVRNPYLSVRPDGSAVIAARMEGAITFGPTTVTSVNGQTVVVARITAAGDWAWAAIASSSSSSRGLGIAALADNAAVVVGYFSGELTLGSETLMTAETDGSNDIFVATISAAGAWP